MKKHLADPIQRIFCINATYVAFSLGRPHSMWPREIHDNYLRYGGNYREQNNNWTTEPKIRRDWT